LPLGQVSARSGVVWALALSDSAIRVSDENLPWLRMSAAKAAPPK
jgi:hypothetical protein